MVRHSEQAEAIRQAAISEAMSLDATIAGGSAGADDAAERGALLDRAVACLGDGGAARWPLVARAAAALVGADAACADPASDPAAAAAEARAARWWQEDAESAALQADLTKLARGVSGDVWFSLGFVSLGDAHRNALQAALAGSARHAGFN